MADPSVPIDRATARRFVRVVKDFLTSDVKARARARALFGLLFLCALAVNGLNVVNSYVGRDFRPPSRTATEAATFGRRSITSACFWRRRQSR